MKRFYLISCLLVSSVSSFAQIEPNEKPEIPVDGKEYVLVNQAMSASQYMSRTSWDGALYFLGKDDSHYADYAFTAHKNDDNTWSFTLPGSREVETGDFDDDGNPIIETEDAPYYMVMPSGTANINFRQDIEATWKLDQKDYQYFNLILEDGHNYEALRTASLTPTGDLRMHLNAGCQYFVATYQDGPWYPDCYRGITETNDESTGDVLFAATDSISFLWGFVSVDRVPAYMLDYAAYKSLLDYESEYLGEGYEDYSEGFQSTFNTALQLYKSEEFNSETDGATISAILKKKVDFYNLIEEAQLLEEPSTALTTAINNAIASFKTVTSESEVDSAIDALRAAIQAFKEGTGDYTSMGKNMSFEDLSAQGGGETSSVSDVPVGWNMYINGVQVYTASEIRANGISTWCGVNSDSNGSGKDGNESFGIWNGGIPTFELSQTIEGLENGTYIVSAGLMAGDNGSGSRMTTQRIFGNLNSTYYADPDFYNPEALIQSEVYAFASNPQVQTDTELYPVEVRAYVYDGTLTFGVRTDGNLAACYRTSGNPAGGDGWFKVDNFRIQKVGYVGEDAANVANHFINVISSYLDEEVFSKSLEDELKSVMSGEVDPSTPSSEINNIITTLKDKIPEIESSIDLYKKLWSAVEDGISALDDYSYTPSAEAVLIPAVSDGEVAYDERTSSDEEINEIISNIYAAIAQVKSEAVQVGEYANVIINGSFEDLSAQNNVSSGSAENPPAGWTLVLNGMECSSRSQYSEAGASFGWCAINEGDGINAVDLDGNTWTHQYTDGTHLWGIWCENVPDVELSQTVLGLPAGTYTLSCDVVVEWNWGGKCLTTQRIFANRYVKMFGSDEYYLSTDEEESIILNPALATADMDNAFACDSEYPEAEYKHLSYAGYTQTTDYHETSCPRHMELTFGLLDGEDLKFGFRTNNVDVETGAPFSYPSAGWFKLDNFRLLYESADVPEGADATRINDISNGNVSVVGQQYYSLSGSEISRPQRGINIVKTIMSDGSVRTRKVFVK